MAIPKLPQDNPPRYGSGFIQQLRWLGPVTVPTVAEAPPTRRRLAAAAARAAARRVGPEYSRRAAPWRCTGLGHELE